MATLLPDLSLVRDALDAALVGHDEAKSALLLGWLARVHVLLEGPPGCGKSALAKALADVAGERCARADASAGLRLASQLHRKRDGALERIHLARVPLDPADLLVLDDVEHVAANLAVPLLAQLERDGALFAVATRTGSELEPAAQGVLERFPLRVRMCGALAARREHDARALLERTPLAAASPPLAAGRAAALRAELRGVALPDPVLCAAARALACNGVVSPRLVRVLPRLLRARALLRGAERVEIEDVHALLDEALPGTAARVGVVQGFAAVPGAASDARAGDGAASGAGAAQDAPPARERVLAAAAAARPAVPREAGAVEALVAALSGGWGRGRSERHADASGAPRRRRALRDLAESTDADPAELLAYLDGESPERPAVLQRERRGAARALLILRDVSASMQGPGARWSLRLVRALVDAARAQRLRVGYVEFNHVADRFTQRGRLAHRAYAALGARAAEAVCTGRTSYQAALGAALAARLPRAACDVVMISDGIPVVGDPAVQRERRLARRRGWKLHTVFVGLPPVPAVLVELARETGGLAFCVAPAPSRELAAAPHWSLQQVGGHGR